MAAVMLWAAPIAHADTTLPTSGFGDMVVDDVHHQVFVSHGWGGSSVSVLDYDGNLIDTITGLSYPFGMALDPATSTLYVALHGGSGIATIDTATRTVTDELSVAPWTGPKWLGLAGGRLWFSHDCITSADAGMASIALDGSDLQTPDGADLPYYCPMFAPSPADPNVMAVVDIGVSPSTVYVYDVSTSTPSLLVGKRDPVGGSAAVEDLVISPDGTELLGSSSTAGGVPVFRLSDLARLRTYSGHGSPNSAAISSDGAFVAAGRGSSFDDPDVIVYNAATLLEVRRFTFTPTSNTLYDGGLAFSPDKSRLFAVYITNNSETVFRAIPSPTGVAKATSTSLTLSASKVRYNRALTVKAHVTGSKTGTVSIYAKPYGSTKTLVDSGPLNENGNFSTTFKPAKKTTFTAEYEGTDVHAPSKSSGKTVLVYAVATVVMGGYYDISGKYKLFRRGTYPQAIGGLKPTHFGSKLKFIVQRYYLGAWRTVANDTFAADGGTVWAEFVSTNRGTYRIHTVFAGDAENLADTSPWAYFKIT